MGRGIFRQIYLSTHPKILFYIFIYPHIHKNVEKCMSKYKSMYLGQVAEKTWCRETWRQHWWQCTRGHCLAVTERESPFDLCLCLYLYLCLYFICIFYLYLQSAPEATVWAVKERESPSDLALLDFISAPLGPTKDIDLVERKLSRAAKWRVENWPNWIWGKENPVAFYFIVKLVQSFCEENVFLISQP